jgi:hypothetical protein
MSKIIILPNTGILHRKGNITYKIGKLGEELDLKVNVTHPHEADFIGMSIALKYLERIIAHHEATTIPDDVSPSVIEAHHAAIDKLKEHFLILKAHQNAASKLVLGLFNINMS